jgi:lipid-A-disaccharide synthase
MEAAGMRLEENLAQKLPIIGLTQVIRNYGKLKKLMNRARQMLQDEKPDALVLIDYPGFNLRLARFAHEAGIPVIYYISPQVWAWHKSRLKIISTAVTRMLVILPFEEAFFRSAGVPVTYVGHPLLDDQSPVRPRTEILRELGLDPEKRVIGLLPGSRNGEVIRHMPVLLECAELIQKSFPEAQFVLPRASTIDKSLIEKYLSLFPAVKVKLAETDLKSARAAMDFAICKSGTSTLELALLGVPMIIIYRVSIPTYLLAKAVLRIPWIGLVNIVANEEIAPELKQFDATPSKMASAALSYLNNPARLDAQREGLAKVRARIGKTGASSKAALEIADLLLQKQSGD